MRGVGSQPEAKACYTLLGTGAYCLAAVADTLRGSKGYWSLSLSACLEETDLQD